VEASYEGFLGQNRDVLDSRRPRSARQRADGHGALSRHPGLSPTLFSGFCRAREHRCGARHLKSVRRYLNVVQRRGWSAGFRQCADLCGEARRHGAQRALVPALDNRNGSAQCAGELLGQAAGKVFRWPARLGGPLVPPGGGPGLPSACGLGGPDVMAAEANLAGAMPTWLRARAASSHHQPHRKRRYCHPAWLRPSILAGGGSGGQGQGAALAQSFSMAAKTQGRVEETREREENCWRLIAPPSSPLLRTHV